MSESIEINMDEVISNLNIEIVLKSGRVLNVEDIVTDDVIGGIYDEWQYGGVADPLGQAAATIINSLSSVINTAISGVSSLISSVSSVVNSISSTVSSILSKVNSIASSITSAVSSITNLISSKINDVLSRISNAVSTITSSISSGISNVLSAIDKIAGQINSLVPTISSKIQDFATKISDSVQNAISSVIKSISELTTSITSIMASLSEGIANLTSGISNALFKLTEGVKSLTGSVTQSIEDLSSNMTAFATKLSEFGGMIYNQIEGLVSSLSTFVEGLGKQVTEFAASISSTVTDMFYKFQSMVSATVEEFVKKFAGWFAGITEGINNIVTAFQGFINPLVGILHWFENQFQNIGKWIWEGLVSAGDAIHDAFVKPITDWFDKNIFETDWWKGLTGFFATASEVFSDISGGIASAINLVKDASINAINTSVEIMKNAISAVVSATRNTVTAMVSSFAGLFEGIFNWAISIVGLDRGKTIFGESRKEIIDVINLGLVTMLDIIAVYYVYYMSSNFITNVSEIVDSVEASVEPVGIGGKVKMSLKSVVRSIPDTLKLVYKELVKTLVFTFSFWLFEPVKYLINPFWRESLPIEIPTFHEMVKTARRYLPTNVASKAIEKLRDVMAMRGYPIWFEDATVKGWELTGFEVVDRFGKSRVIPTALLYELPTPTDTVRFMLRDIIQDVKHFENIMLAQGFNRDIALMYYLLHFRYPPLDKLYDFVCRTAAGLAWFKAGSTVKKEFTTFVNDYGLGFIPKSPAELNASLPDDPQAALKVIRNHILGNLDKISPYLKWHDYFPASWVKGDWTSDQMIIADLMADIPMRIDSRWMYKWGIIDEIGVLKIVTARGMHPDWIEPIATAEMMNALAEERTFVRTGIINAYKEGFIDAKKLFDKFTHLTDVTLLGKKVAVKFLEGEAKLLQIRAQYDRALDILREELKYLGRAYAENIIPYDGMTQRLREVVEAVNEKVGIDLNLDMSYYEAYQFSLDALKDVNTTYRMRRWLRYMIYQLLSRAQSGYIDETDINEILEAIKHYGKLTDEEIEFFSVVLTFMKSSFSRESIADGILKQLSRGLITKEEAKNLLIKLGIDSEVVDFLIESKAKTYTLSIGTYLSYADMLEIPEEMMKKKLELMGVPPDEQNLIMQVFKIKPIKSEVAKVVSEVLDAFRDGYITENEARNIMRQYGIREDSLNLLIAAKKIEQTSRKRKYFVDAILNRLKRGVMSLSDARKELKKVIVDDELIDALLEKNVRTYTFSVDKMISMSEYIPIDMNWILEKAQLFGYPEEEIKIIPAYKIAKDLSEEIGRLATELGNDYVEGLLTEDEFKKALDDLATLGGQVKQLGVDWIVLSPEERALLVTLYKLRKQRKELSKKS